MAERNLILHDDATNSEGSENLSHDEWTIIGENCCRKDDTDEETNAPSRIEEIEEHSLSMELINVPGDDATDDEAGSVTVDKQGDDSDGISVITESEAEQLVVNKKFGEIDDCKNRVCAVLKTGDKQGEKTVPQVGTVLNVVIACSLAAIIGLGAGRILGMDDKCPVTSAIDFATIKMESDVLINQIKELSEVRDVLDEIKASIPEVKRAHKEISKRRRSKRSEDRDKPAKISDTYVFDPDTTILEQLQTSLNTLCSVIEGINPENDFIKLDTPKTRSVVEDLIEFKKIIHNVVKEIGDTERPKEIEFLRIADKRIRDVCKSLLRDLSYTVNGLTMKIHHKLNKVRQKLNRRLCLLKNSETADRQVFKLLDENNSFLQSCDNILNVTFNPTQQSMKPKKKKALKSYKVYSKTSKTTFNKIPTSESEDDSYPRDSSSESSVPDLSYNPGTDEFWNEKEAPHQVGCKTKKTIGKIPLENSSNRRKMKNSKSVKSSGDRSCRKLIMEVLVPRESCPLTREHWLAADSGGRLELETLKQKPLYSSILKSVTKEEEFNGKLIAEDTQGDVDAEAIKQRAQESRIEVAEAKEKPTETKHNVTPAESGMDVETAKSMKDERNANIRKPAAKHNRVLRRQEALGSDENSESQKQCRKGKKCASDSAAPSTESKKKPDAIKHEKINIETTDDKNSRKRQNDESKKPKKSKISDETSNKGFKKRNYNQKINSQLAADWQLQRSRAREMHRNSDHRSEWFFDRADSRQDARKNVDSKSRSPDKCHRGEKCEPDPEDPTHDEESFFDYRWEKKDFNDQKHSGGSRAGFTAKMKIKMPHRKNILQHRRR